MAVDPMGTCNGVGNVLLAEDLGLSAGTILASASPKALTSVHLPLPETVAVLVKLSSGTVDVQVDVATSSTFVSSDSSTGAVAGTYWRGVVVNTTSTEPYVNIRLVTSANCIVDGLVVLPISRLVDGEEFRSVRAGRNAVGSSHMTSSSDGSGVYDSSVSA